MMVAAKAEVAEVEQAAGQAEGEMAVERAVVERAVAGRVAVAVPEALQRAQ